MLFLQNNPYQLAINIFVGASLTLAAGVAFVALGRGGLPPNAGAAPEQAKGRPVWPVYAGVALAVPVFAFLVQKNDIAGGMLFLFGGGAFVWLLVRSGNMLFRTWNALRPRRRRGGAALADTGFAPHEREWMRAHVAACVAAFAGWVVSAQFGSIGYYWTLYYVLGLSVAAHEILIRRLAWARGGIARGPSPAGMG